MGRGVKDEVDLFLERVNSVLLRGKVRIHQGNLYYRSSHFPLKGGKSGKKGRYDMALGVKREKLLRNKRGQEDVQAVVLEWDRLVFRNQWIWVEEKVEERLKTAADWIAEYEKWYWSKREQTANAESNFKSSILSRLQWLPVWMVENNVAEFDVSVIETVLVAKTKPESKNRLDSAIVLAAFGRWMGWDISKVQDLGKGWSPSMLTPRDLPVPSEIVAQYHKLAKVPGVQAGYLVMALYGVRPHELAFIEPLGIDQDSPWIHITKKKGTGKGSRDAYELRVDGLDLPRWDGMLPEIDAEGKTVKWISNHINALYRKHGVTKLYNLRHHYAQMGFINNKPIDKMALSMGHSIAVHTKTYRAWINRQAFQDSWQ